jgi:glycerol-3-phosphate cytidylyltransferase
MFKEAKESCDYLVVAVQTDPTIDRPNKNKPVQSIEERVGQVKAIRYVDVVLIYETEEQLVELIKSTNPDVRFVGEDWRGKEFTGHDIPDVEIIFNSRNHKYSSTALRKAVIEAGE